MLASLVPGTVQGLPTHALIVHFTVVGLPLTTLALLLCAFSARMRARIGIVLPLAGIASLILVPLSTSTGQDLKARAYFAGPVGNAILRHQRAAQQLLPWAFGLAVMCIVVYIAGRRGPRAANPVGAVATAGTPRPALASRSAVSVAVAVLATVVAVGTAVQVTFVGHLGSEAVWQGYSQRPVQKNVPAGN